MRSGFRGRLASSSQGERSLFLLPITPTHPLSSHPTKAEPLRVKVAINKVTGQGTALMDWDCSDGLDGKATVFGEVSFASKDSGESVSLGFLLEEPP